MVVPIIIQGPGKAKQKLQTSPEMNGNGVLEPEGSSSFQVRFISFSREPGFTIAVTCDHLVQVLMLVLGHLC